MLALYTVSALFGIGYGGISICYPVLVREHLPPAEAGRRLGVILLFGTLAMALGGWLAGHIFDSTGGYTPAFVIGAACNAVNLIIVLALIQPHAEPERGRIHAARAGLSGGGDGRALTSTMSSEASTGVA